MSHHHSGKAPEPKKRRMSKSESDSPFGRNKSFPKASLFGRIDPSNPPPMSVFGSPFVPDPNEEGTWHISFRVDPSVFGLPNHLFFRGKRANVISLVKHIHPEREFQIYKITIQDVGSNPISDYERHQHQKELERTRAMISNCEKNLTGLREKLQVLEGMNP